MLLSNEKGTKYYDFKSLKTDLFVLGSDQIWNPDITSGFDNVYFGNIPCESQVKIISYAASLGKSNFSELDRINMRQLLSNIDKISVREPDAKKIIDELLTESESTVVVDPTILAGKSYFEPLIKKINEEPYVLLYSLQGIKALRNWGQALGPFCQRQHLKFVSICPFFPVLGANAENRMADQCELLVIRMRNAWNGVNDAYKQVEIAIESIGQAEENLRLQSDYYKAGTCTMSDLLEAQTLYQQSRDKYVEIYSMYEIKKREYLQATGR